MQALGLLDWTADRHVQSVRTMITDTRERQPFDVQPTIDGFAVIDARTGRPLDTRSTVREAWGFATVLNQAAIRGPKALAKALKAA